MASSFSIKNFFLVLTSYAALLPLAAFTCTGNAENSSKDMVRFTGDSMIADILYQVNRYRQLKALAPLQMNPVIAAEAKKHSTDMAMQKTVFGHEGFENRIRLIVQQLGPMRSAAENVAFGSLTAKEVVDGWLKSPGHRKNIEGNYTITGIGVATSSNGTVFFTQIFTAK